MVKIDEDTRFSMNDDSYVLEHRIETAPRTDGKPNIAKFHWITDGYYPSLASMLTSYVTNAPRRKNSTKIHTIQGVIDRINDAEARIIKLLPKNN